MMSVHFGRIGIELLFSLIAQSPLILYFSMNAPLECICAGRTRLGGT